MFNHCSDTSELITALAFVKQALLKSEKQAMFIDTYANLLYKLGHVEEAIKNEELAVSVDEAQVYKETLAKMKVGVKTWENER